MSSSTAKVLRILSLDGGGVKGFSSLLVLERIFRTIQRVHDLSELPRPCDYFDLIGGTSTGGLIAIMLGRLRMTIPECLEVFENFSRDVFGRGNPPGTIRRLLGGATGRAFFNKDDLENSIKALLQARGLDEDLPMRDSNDVACKVFVCATTAETLHRELLRSYTTREVSESDYDCYLWEAARATTAAPLFFEPITLQHSGETLVDGGMRFNNPIYEVLNEAEQLYPNAKYDCIISLGTGWSGVTPLGDSHLNGFTVLQTCVDLAINAHNEAEKFAGDKRGEDLLNSRRYFRFDVDHGIDTVTLEEWTKLPKIRAHTARYLARTDEKRNLEDCAKRLSGLELNVELKISSNAPNLPRLKSTLSHYSNPNFSGRAELLLNIERCMEASSRTHQRVALWGLGGIGKSQIAFEYARRLSSERSTFWVKANSIDNFLNGYLSVGQELGLEFNQDQDQKTVLGAVKTYLESNTAGPWLLVLDEADEKEKFLEQSGSPGLMEYMPRAEHGQIIITTRDSRVVGLADGQVVPAQNGVFVGPFPIDQGIELFHKSVRSDTIQNSTVDDIKSFIVMLGGLPLAIVQAAAFIREEGVSISEFTKLYEDVERHEELFQENSFSTDLEQKSVLYTWEISYKRIAGPEYPLSKSPAAIVLDLLGFLDSHDSATRTLTESQQVASEEGRPLEKDAWLDNIIGPQVSPRAVISRIYEKYIQPQGMLSSGIGRLRNYSLVSTSDCWVHPVVHSWIYRRLPNEERHKYFCWVVEEFTERLGPDQPYVWDAALFRSETDYQDFVPLASLPTIRNARVFLGLALSPKMVQYRSETKFTIPGLGYFLNKIGRELSTYSRTEEALHYLGSAVTEAKELSSSASVIFRWELDFLKVRGRMLPVNQATEEAKEFLATPIAENSLEARTWLAECLIAEGSILEGANQFENLELVCPLTSDTMEDQKELVALKVSTARALRVLGDSISMARSRRMLDSIIELVSSAHPGHITKINLGPMAFKLRFEIAEGYEDRCNVCRKLIEYEEAEETSFHGVLGGLPQLWTDYLSDMNTKQQWTELEVFAKTYTTSRASLFDMLQYRSNLRGRYYRTEYLKGRGAVRFEDRYYSTVAGWAEMHDLLGQAYFHLGNLEAAEASFWSAFVIYLFGVPEMTITEMWPKHLHHLVACLHQQGEQRKDTLKSLKSSYSRVIRQSEEVFGPIDQDFKSHKRGFQQFSED